MKSIELSRSLRSAALLLCLAASGLLAACGGGGGGSSSTPQNNGTNTTVVVTGVTINQSSLNLTVGDTATLVATVAPDNATNKNVTWSSDTPSVATVNASTGVVTSVAAGTAKITVTTADGGKTASITANVATATPTISSFTPTEAKHGEVVMITGTNFGATAGENTVTIGGITAQILGQIAYTSETELFVRVPKNLAVLGAAPNSVQVTVAGKTATAVERFTYVPTYASSILAGSLDGGFVDSNTDATAKFSYPKYVAVDTAGNVYVADTDNHSIRKITPGGTVSTLAGTGAADFFDTLLGIPALGIKGKPAQFNFPRGVAVDTAGNVYVADTDNLSIRKITTDGIVTTLAGTYGHPGSMDGASDLATFLYPDGVAVDATGNVYVADTGNHSIRKITPGGTVSTLAGNGFAGFSNGRQGAGGIVTIPAQFFSPEGVAVDVAGNVLVADTGNRRIRKITPAGAVSTLAGDGSLGSADNQNPLLAQFRRPTGVAVDAAGNVLVADTGSPSIRKITPAGAVTTLAAGINAVGGARGVAVDAAGNIYVAGDAYNSIYKLTPE